MTRPQGGFAPLIPRSPGLARSSFREPEQHRFAPLTGRPRDMYGLLPDVISAVQNRPGVHFWPVQPPTEPSEDDMDVDEPEVELRGPEPTLQERLAWDDIVVQTVREPLQETPRSVFLKKVLLGTYNALKREQRLREIMDKHFLALTERLIATEGQRELSPHMNAKTKIDFYHKAKRIIPWKLAAAPSLSNVSDQVVKEITHLDITGKDEDHVVEMLCILFEVALPEVNFVRRDKRHLPLQVSAAPTIVQEPKKPSGLLALCIRISKGTAHPPLL